MCCILGYCIVGRVLYCRIFYCIAGYCIALTPWMHVRLFQFNKCWQIMNGDILSINSKFYFKLTEQQIFHKTLHDRHFEHKRLCMILQVIYFTRLFVYKLNSALTHCCAPILIYQPAETTTPGRLGTAPGPNNSQLKLGTFDETCLALVQGPGDQAWWSQRADI